MRRSLPPRPLSRPGYLILSAAAAVEEGRRSGPVVLFTGADRRAAAALYEHALLRDDSGVPRVTEEGRRALRAYEEKELERSALLKEPELV